MKDLTRAERRELAQLLEDARLWMGPTPAPDGVTLEEPDWGRLEEWTDLLRHEAGPAEPTSHAARFIGRTNDETEWEWARRTDGLWYCLNGSRADGLPWDDLVEAYHPYHEIKDLT